MHDKLAAWVAFAIVSTGCAGAKRGPEMYRYETQRLLETRSPLVKSCYDDALKADPRITGLVTVQFIVEKKTGAFIKAIVDPMKSNATESLVLCVLNIVDGLTLEPPDANEGRATFVYEFKPTTPPS